MKKISRKIAGYFRELDKTMLVMCVIMSVFSVVLLFTMNSSGISAQVSDRQWQTNALATGIGITAALILSAADYRVIAKMWFIYAPAASCSSSPPSC